MQATPTMYLLFYSFVVGGHENDQHRKMMIENSILEIIFSNHQHLPLPAPPRIIICVDWAKEPSCPACDVVLDDDDARSWWKSKTRVDLLNNFSSFTKQSRDDDGGSCWWPEWMARWPRTVNFPALTFLSKRNVWFLAVINCFRSDVRNKFENAN